MKEEIRQHGKVILSGTDGISIPMLFNNLSGKNLVGEEYRAYIKRIAYREMGVVPGEITYYRNGNILKEALLPEID